jgi:hypothetical protein
MSMSLYMLGKIIDADVTSVRRQLVAIAADISVRAEIDDLDPEDRSVLAHPNALRSAGLHFSIYSGTEETDATQLWIEAMAGVRAVTTQECVDVDEVSDAALFAFLRSRLGRLSQALLQLGSAVGIALVDGGVDSFYENSAHACLRRIACDVTKTWDQSSNRLYVCRNDSV